MALSQQRRSSRSTRPANNGMNLTVRPVTRLAGLTLTRDSNGSAQGARPARPAGYAGRSADLRRRNYGS